MLIICQPKSASTSLTGTIAKAANIKAVYGVPKDAIDINCEGFKELQKYHTNMCERSPIFIKQVLTGRKKIFKEHLLPTDRHLEILNKFKIPIVVILRNVDDTLDAYDRLFKEKNVKYNKKELRKDIKDFHDRWMHYKSNRANVIVIYYRDLVLNYKGSMAKILKHYKLSGKVIPMLKARYTGIGVKRILEEKKEYIEITEEKDVIDSTTEKRVDKSNVYDSGDSENTTQERTESSEE